MKNDLIAKISSFVGIIVAIIIFAATNSIISLIFGFESTNSQINTINWATFIYIPFCVLTILMTKSENIENDKSKLSKVLKTFSPIISFLYVITVLITFFSLFPNR